MVSPSRNNNNNNNINNSSNHFILFTAESKKKINYTLLSLVFRIWINQKVNCFYLQLIDFFPSHIASSKKENCFSFFFACNRVCGRPPSLPRSQQLKHVILLRLALKTDEKQTFHGDLLSIFFAFQFLRKKLMDEAEKRDSGNWKVKDWINYYNELPRLRVKKSPQVNWNSVKGKH